MIRILMITDVNLNEKFSDIYPSMCRVVSGRENEDTIFANFPFDSSKDKFIDKNKLKTIYLPDEDKYDIVLFSCIANLDLNYPIGIEELKSIDILKDNAKIILPKSNKVMDLNEMKYRELF